MKHWTSILAAVAILVTGSLSAQELQNFQRTAPIVSPEITATTVTFRLRAPQATDVRVQPSWLGYGPEAAEAGKMTKGENGVWTKTFDRPASELYTYTFSVDGVSTLDPANVFVQRDGTRFMNALILDGGPCEVGLESTVIDVTGGVPRVLRPGGVTPERIAAICGGVQVDDAVMRPLKEGERPRSPGMKYRHYAPAGALTIVKGEERAVASAICRLYDEALGQGKRPLILALNTHLPAYGARRALSLGSDAGEMAHEIFARLRDADALGADALFSEAVGTEGVGLAVMNRLGRAAAFHIVEVK